MEKTSRPSFLGRHQSCCEEKIEILPDLIECNYSSRNTSSFCIPKYVRMETGEVLYEKVYMSPRPPPKISLKHEWKREMGSEHAQRPEVGQLSRSFQPNKPIPNPSRERTWRRIVKDDTRTVQDGRKTSRSQEIDVTFSHEETVSSERTRRPVVETNTENVPDACQTRSCHESETFNVGDNKTLRERKERPDVNHDDSRHE